MKKRRLLALCVACLMLFALLAGCGNGDSGSSGSSGDSGGSSDGGSSGTDGGSDGGGGDVSTTTPPSERDFFEFEYYWNYDWADTSPVWGADTVSGTLKDMFNIGLRITKPDIDPDQMMGIMITSGELPDVMMIERDAIYQQLIELDMLLPLDEYIAGSTYEELLGHGTINMSRVNGNVYGLLNWATSEPTGNNGWAVNRDIWEELGSPPLDTTEQMLNYLITVRDAGLTVGGAPVIPLQFSTNFFMVEQAMASFGIRDMDGVTDINGDLKLYMTAPRAEEAFLWLNRLWNEGLINSDHFVETSEQVSEKLSIGRVAVYCGNDITSRLATDIRSVFLSNNPGNDYLVIHPPAAPGINQSEVWNTTWYSLGWNVIVFTKNAPHPDRIFELIDYVHSNEGSLLTYQGPQGILWDELDADGFPIMTRPLVDLSAEERDALGVNGMWTLLGNAPFWDLSKVADNNRQPPDQKDWTTSAQVDIIWRHSMYADAYLNIHPTPQDPEGIAQSTYVNLNEQYIPRIVTAADEAAARAALQDAINAIYGQNFQLVEEFKTDIYKANLALLS